MRKHLVRMIATLSVVAVALTFAGVVRAQEAAPKAKAPKTHSANGEITALDAKDSNPAANLIANTGEEEGCPAWWIKLSASQDGSFTVYNSRTKFRKAYK